MQVRKQASYAGRENRMKRMRTWLLIAVMALATACVPTPDEEFVVNKGDSIVEQKLAATAKPVDASVPADAGSDAAQSPEAGIDAPKRWDEELTVSDNLSILFNAAIEVPSDGLCPVYRTKKGTMEGKELTAVSGLERTKAELQMEMKWYLDDAEEQLAWDEAGRPDWGDRDEAYVPTREEIEERKKAYMEQIEAAPEENRSVPVSDYSGAAEKRGTSIFTLSTGESAYVDATGSYLSIARGCDGSPYIYPERWYEQEKNDIDGSPAVKLWHDVTLSEQAARETLDRVLADLGLTDFAVVDAYTANLMTGEWNMRYVTGGWTFDLVRNYGNYIPYRLIMVSDQIDFGQGEDDYMPPLEREMLEIFVAEDGVRSLFLMGKKDVVALENANVEILPFADVQQAAKKALSALYRIPEYAEKPARLEVYAIKLITVTTRVKNAEEYYEMPCWALLFDDVANNPWKLQERDSAEHYHDALLINALDGSIVQPGRGY